MQCTAAERQFAIAVVEKTISERPGQAGAAVRGGAASQTKHNTRCASIDRGMDQFSGAIGGCRQRVALGGGDVFDSACRSQLDHRGAYACLAVGLHVASPTQESVLRADRPSQCVVHMCRFQLAPSGPDQCSGQSLAAGGQRHHTAFGIRVACQHSASHRFRHGLRRCGLFERIRRQQVFHGFPPVVVDMPTSPSYSRDGRPGSRQGGFRGATRMRTIRW